MRRLVYKAGRRMYCWARGEVKNTPTINGEYWLIEKVIRNSSGALTLIDIGANRGNWSAHASTILNDLPKGYKAEAVIHAFEPCKSTYEILSDNLRNTGFVQIHRLGFSNREGHANFYSIGAGTGTNSLHPEPGAVVEVVKLTTLDAFLPTLSTCHVNLVKADTEGFDYFVLSGAVSSLSKGRIDCLQFEYNWRWLINNKSLRDVFQLIDQLPYRIAKLTGKRLIVFDAYHFELDRFFEGNYVLVKIGSSIEKLCEPVHFDASNVLCY